MVTKELLTTSAVMEYIPTQLPDGRVVKDPMYRRLPLPSGRRMGLGYNSALIPEVHLQYDMKGDIIEMGQTATKNIEAARRDKFQAELLESGTKHEYIHGVVEEAVRRNPHLLSHLDSVFSSYNMRGYYKNFISLFQPLYRSTRIHSEAELNSYYLVLQELFAFAAQVEKPTAVIFHKGINQAAKDCIKRLQEIFPFEYDRLKALGIGDNQEFEKDYPIIRAYMESLVPRSPSRRQMLHATGSGLLAAARALLS